MKNNNGFLIVDIAFSLLIISFALVLILYVQYDVSKKLNTSDIQNLYKSNNEIFTNIKKGKCKKYSIRTKNNYSYDVCLVEAGNQDEVVLHYYMLKG